MIDTSLTTASSDAASAALTMSQTSPSDKGAFDAALQAALKAKALKASQDSEFNEIRSKGFRNWVRDTRAAELKQELERKVMAEMGVTPADMAKMSSAMRRILEQKIKDEVEKRLADLSGANSGTAGADAASSDKTSAADQSSGTAQSQSKSQPQNPPATIAAQESQDQTTAGFGAQTAQPGKKRRADFAVEVIPALATPGGPSLF